VALTVLGAIVTKYPAPGEHPRPHDAMLVLKRRKIQQWQSL
jgi:hypothetical protein